MGEPIYMENVDISVIVLAYNEAERIRSCMSRLSWAKEIIVVDNTSTDETAKLAKNAATKVITTAEESFSKLRELGVSHAKYDWVFYVDADEWVTPELAREIATIVNEPGEKVYAAYWVKRDSYYLGKKWPRGDRMMRLFFKKSLKGWKGNVHESPIVTGDVGELVHPLQ